MVDVILKIVDYENSLTKVYQSCMSTLLPLIRDYRKGIITSKWRYFVMMLMQAYVILFEAGIIQMLEHIIVTFVCPGVGHIIVSFINIVQGQVVIKKIEDKIHAELKKYEAEYAKNVMVPEHKPHKEHYGIFANVLRSLNLPPDTSPQKALDFILKQKVIIKANSKSTVLDMLAIYKKEIIVRAYCD